jgi:hypothetical protein
MEVFCGNMPGKNCIRQQLCKTRTASTHQKLVAAETRKVMGDFNGDEYYLEPPERLPRRLTEVNSSEARTILAKLLRYEQAGNLPAYGSADTEPPWWPNDRNTVILIMAHNVNGTFH